MPEKTLPEKTRTAGDVVRDLERARVRTLGLTDLDEPVLLAQHDPLMSPLVWDLAHIGQQEELWLLRGGDLTRPGMLPPDVDSLYDAFKHRRADRPMLPLLPPVEARAFNHEVRGRVLDVIERTAADDLFTAGMVVQHEEQHDETMLATLQLRQGPPVLLPRRTLPPGRPVAGERVLVPGGPFTLGVDAAREPFSLDNERPAHTVDLGPFWIGKVPVTSGQWAEFMADGGYRRPELWSDRGWAHRAGPGWSGPSSGPRPAPGAGSGWRRTFRRASPCSTSASSRPRRSRRGPAPGCRPRPSGRRRAPGTRRAGVRRAWPWGNADPSADVANLGGQALRPAPAGAYPAGASAYGAEQMIGDVWEWTSSDFTPWPGFTPMIYRMYSEPFFGGDYKVLRGGSWAVAPSAIRPSFRNWDHPIRRQIFTGVRLAWDA